MVLNASGPISLAGSTAGQSIAVELGLGATTAITLNDAAVRTLAGVPSGAIIMPTNFYGKSSRANISYTFTTSTVNASLNVTSIGGYVAGATTVTVTVNASVYLWSNAVATPGLTLSGGSGTDIVNLINNGYIMGKGGDAKQRAVTYPINGLPGGTALSIGYNISLTNNSYIGGGGGSGASGWAGGGGGAGGGCGLAINGGGAGGAIGAVGANGQNCCCACGGKGGGAGAGGGGSNCTCSGYGAGGGGGRIFPGTGGAGGYGRNSYGGNGGASNAAGQTTQWTGGGGGWGAVGGNGSGTGGAGGKAIALNGKTVTYVVTGNVWGAVS